MTRRTRSGFTLLEIIVVLAILGLGMALISQMTEKTAKYSERVEEETAVQLACQNMMNSILSGNAVALIGMENPIPDMPNWTTTVELLDGPIDKIVAIRITAQRYNTFESPSALDPNTPIVTREPDYGRRYVVKEWARRSQVRTRVVRVNADGSVAATDGTGETVANDLAEANAAALGGAPGSTELMDPNLYDPFASIDQSLNLGGNASENERGGLGGGLGGFGGFGFNEPGDGIGGGLGGGLGGARNGGNYNGGGLGGMNDFNVGGFGGGF